MISCIYMIWLIQKLAVKIGVTSQAVSKWERGQSLPDIITFSQLCNILDVSADVLLEMNSNIISENTDVHINTEILKELRQCQASLELIFGKDLIEAFQKQPIMPYIAEIRLDLERQGLLRGKRFLYLIIRLFVRLSKMPFCTINGWKEMSQ